MVHAESMRGDFEWNLNENANLFIQEEAYENVIKEMLTLFCKPWKVNILLSQ